jgi:hypothetical protein
MDTGEFAEAFSGLLNHRFQSLRGADFPVTKVLVDALSMLGIWGDLWLRELEGQLNAGEDADQRGTEAKGGDMRGD